MKITNVEAQLSAVMPTGQFSNFKPTYTLSATLDEGDVPEVAIGVLRDKARKMLEQDWTRLHNKDKFDFFSTVRWYSDKKGNKYPSVTSILAWADILYKLRNPNEYDYGGITEDELDEYAARGTLVHEAVETWFKTGQYVVQTEANSPDALKLQDSKLKAEDCNFLGFWEEHGKDFSIKFMEREVVDPVVGYGGRLDMYGTYKGVPAIIDIKTTSTYTAKVDLKYFKQLSAYARAVKGVKKPECLVIIPLNPSNKCGYGKPRVSTDIDAMFSEFKKDVNRFKSDFSSLM